MQDDWGWSDPGTLLGVLFREAGRCWPSAGLLVPARVSSNHTWEAWMWSAIAGAQRTGACSRLSPPVPGPHGGRGHTCRTPPWACSVCSQSDASSKRVRSCRTRCVQLGVGSRHPRPYIVNGVRMDTIGHSDAPAACIAMEGSGRAGPSVVVNASRREECEEGTTSISSLSTQLMSLRI